MFGTIIIAACVLATSPVHALTFSDSLRVEINKASGTKKADLLNELADWYVSRYDSLGFAVAREALELSVSLKYPVGIAEAYGAMGSHTRYSGDPRGALKFYRLGLSAVDSLESLNVTGVLRSRIGDAYANLGMRDEALREMKRGLPILVSFKDFSGAGFCANYIGFLYWQTSVYDSSLAYYMKALSFRETLGNKRDIALTSNNIGAVHYQWGNYVNALTYYLKALRLMEELGDSTRAAMYINNIGVTYRDWGNLDEAMRHFQRALPFSRKIGEVFVISYSLNNIGTVYEKKGDYRTALEYYRQALGVCRAGKDERGLALWMNSIGNLFNLTSKPDSALWYSSEALKSTKERDQQAAAFAIMGRARWSLGDAEGALKSYKKSLTMSLATGNRNQIKDLYFQLSELHGATGDYREALAFHRRFAALKDSIYDNVTAMSFERLKIEYETDRIRRENELLRIKSKNQDTVILLISALFGLMAVSMVVFYRFKKRTFRILSEKNVELSRQHDRIEVQKNEIEAAFLKIKVLSGLIPICSNCKKIRDDTGYWREVESYISTHSDATFSHGICPQCIKKLYPDLKGAKKNE